MHDEFYRPRTICYVDRLAIVSNWVLVRHEGSTFCLLGRLRLMCRAHSRIGVFNNQARQDGIDTDTERSKIDSHLARESENACLQR